MPTVRMASVEGVVTRHRGIVNELVRKLAALAASLVVLSSLGIFGGADAGAITTCGVKNNPHNGFFKDPSRGMVRGVKSTLQVQTSSLCTVGPQEFVTLYNMIYGHGADDGWSQVGYYKSTNPAYSGLTYDWAQYHRDTTDSFHDFYGGHLSAGTAYLYDVEYVPNGCYSTALGVYSCLQNLINGLDFVDTPFDPATAWSNGAWNLEYSEESLFRNGNVPGLSSSQAAVGQMKYETNSYSWLTTDCTLINYLNDDTTHWSHTFSGDCANQTLFTAVPY